MRFCFNEQNVALIAYAESIPLGSATRPVFCERATPFFKTDQLEKVSVAVFREIVAPKWRPPCDRTSAFQYRQQPRVENRAAIVDCALNPFETSACTFALANTRHAKPPHPAQVRRLPRSRGEASPARHRNHSARSARHLRGTRARSIRYRAAARP